MKRFVRIISVVAICIAITIYFTVSLPFMLFGDGNPL